MSDQNTVPDTSTNNPPTDPAPGDAPAIDDNSGRSLASTIATGANASTQSQYPYRATLRTALAIFLAFLTVTPPALAWLATGTQHPALPSNWQAWLLGASAWVTALSGAFTRLMAVPLVDTWLAKIGLSSQPY